MSNITFINKKLSDEIMNSLVIFNKYPEFVPQFQKSVTYHSTVKITSIIIKKFIFLWISTINSIDYLKTGWNNI